jgi:hypothetical protein
MVEDLHEHHKKIRPWLYEILKHTKQNGRSYEWLEVYKEYYTYDRRVVNVYRLEEGNIIMERLQGFTLDNHDEIIKLDLKTRRFIINQVWDIYNKQFTFMRNDMAPVHIFAHNDYKLQNLMYVNGQVRLIDPDSFQMRSLKVSENSMHYSKFYEGFNKLMCYMDKRLDI